MQIHSIGRASVFAFTALAISATSCGDPQGQEVGRDPNTPISLKQNDPKPGVEEPNQANPPSSINDNKNTSEPTTTAPTNNIPDNNPQGAPPVSSAPQPPIPPKVSTLTVSINGIRSVRGNVCLSLFNSPDGFPDSAERAILAECFTVTGNSFDIRINQVPSGTYGIALWHDENRDGKMNYNFLGIPKEGVAFSENGRPRISPPPGPPSFQSIAFEVKGETSSTSTKMTYLLDFL